MLVIALERRNLGLSLLLAVSLLLSGLLTANSLSGARLKTGIGSTKSSKTNQKNVVPKEKSLKEETSQNPAPENKAPSPSGKAPNQNVPQEKSTPAPEQLSPANPQETTVPPQSPAPSSGTYAPGEVLVKFKSGVAPGEAFYNQYSLQFLEKNENIGVYRLKIASGVSVEEMVTTLKNSSEVEYAEPNYQVSAF